MHYSVGDSLRDWMRKHRTTPLATQIQDKLDNQGFLSSEDLNPFIGQAIKEAAESPQAVKGILIDGYPRCMEQLESFDQWPFSAELPLCGGGSSATKPDIVLSVHVAKEKAEARYLKRGRDSNDKKEKFERRFNEYLVETVKVEDVYRKRGIFIDVSLGSQAVLSFTK